MTTIFDIWANQPPLAIDCNQALPANPGNYSVIMNTGEIFLAAYAGNAFIDPSTGKHLRGVKKWVAREARERISTSGWIRCADVMPAVARPVLIYDDQAWEYSVAAWHPGVMTPEGPQLDVGTLAPVASRWEPCCGVEGYECDFMLVPTHWMVLPERPVAAPPPQVKAATVNDEDDHDYEPPARDQ
jgi:hypothetical protein